MIAVLDRFLRINLRVIILTLALLVIFDAALKGVILPHYLDPRGGQGASGTAQIAIPAIRRLPADETNTLALWKKQLADYQGYKVVFLGDSVVYGGGVPHEKNTIPSYLSRQLKLLLPAKEFQVFNFSLPGCTPADTFHILNFIIDAKPDLIIYDGNIGWFGSSKEMEHPRLAGLSSRQTGTGLAAAPTRDKPAAKFDPEKLLTEKLTGSWALYRNRVLLNYLWFGGPLRDKLRIATQPKAANDAVGQLTDDKEIYKPWYQKNFDVLKQTRGKLGSVILNQSNPHWLAYNQLVTKLESERIDSVIFMVPRNKTLYQKYGLLDEKLLEGVQSQLGGTAKDHRVRVFDYTFTVADRDFVDTVHLTAEGNERIAEHLAWDMVNSGVIK